jgi:hypothetical protein
MKNGISIQTSTNNVSPNISEGSISGGRASERVLDIQAFKFSIDWLIMFYVPMMSSKISHNEQY